MLKRFLSILTFFFALFTLSAELPVTIDTNSKNAAANAAKVFSKDKGTISFWHKPGVDLEDKKSGNIREDRLLFAAGDNFRKNGGEYRIWFWNGYIRFDICDQPMTNVRFRIKNWDKNSWQHIAVTWNKNSGIALYVNGVPVDKKSVKWEAPAPGTIKFNASAAKGDRLADVQFYSTDADDKTVTRSYLTSPRKVTRKTFDSGKNNPGRAVKTFSSQNILNRHRGSLLCTVTVPADHQPGEQIFYTLFCSGPGLRKNTNNMQLWLWYGYVRFDLSNIPVNLRTSIKSWRAGEKHHLAVIWDCTQGIKLYVDGIKVDEKNVTWTPDDKITSMTFGEGKNPGVTLENIQLYDAPVTEEFISSEAAVLARSRQVTASFATGNNAPGYHALRATADGKLNSAAGTVMFWYRPDIDLGAKGKDESAHGIYRLFTSGEKLDKNSGNMRLWVWNNYLRFDICRPGIGNIRTHLPLWPAGEARHIAIVWNCKSGIAMYVNGKKAAGKAGKWQPKKNLGNFAIGSSDVGGAVDGVAGQIVDIQTYDQVIEDFRIAQAASRKPLWQSAAKNTGKAKTLFSLDFEQGLSAAVGNQTVKPSNRNLPELIDGPFGKAALFNGKTKLNFNLAGLIRKDNGSISFWLRTPSRKAMPFPVRSTVFGEQSGRRSGDNRLKLAIRPEFGLRFDPGNGGWGSSYLQESGGWAPESWHHLTFTWDSTWGTEIYIDGKYSGCHGSEEFRSMLPISWKPLYSEAFCVGNDWGANANGWLGALDEFKIHDRKLSAAEIAAEYSSYLQLPLRAAVRDGFICTGKNENIQLLIQNYTAKNFKINVSGSLTHENSGKSFAVNSKSFALNSGRTSIFLPAKVTEQGSYVLDLNISSNGKNNTFRLPLWAISASENSRTKAEERELICEVDVEKISPLVENGKSKIVTSSAGTYREAGNLRYSRFFVPFEVKEMHTPHLAVIEYPDDKPRTMEILMQPFNTNAGFMGHTGVFTGKEYPQSGKMQKFELRFWPQSLRNGLIIMTVENNMPAAIGKVRIYRLKNAMPALQTNDFKGSVPGRKISLFHEDPVIPFIYGRTGTDARQTDMIPALLPFMDDVFTRMLDYNQSFGVNTLHYPISFYRGSMFDSDAEPDSGIVRPVPPDYVKYILRRLNNRNMKFFGVINSAQFESLRKYVMTDPERIRNGEETIYSIRSDGRIFPLAWHRYDSAFNPLDPRVQDAAANFIDDFVKRYGNEPSLAGITVFITRFSPFNFGSMETGYNDGNIAAFEKYCSIKIPVSAKDPERFGKRFQWLRENAWQKWIDFRAKKIYEFHNRLAQTVKRYNKNYRLNLSIHLPVTAGSYLEPGNDLRSLLLESGIDLDLYAGNPDINLIFTHRASYYRHSTAYSELPFGHGNYRSIFTAPEILKPLADRNILLSVNLFDAYFETDIGLRLPIPGLKEKYGFIERRQRASHMNAGQTLSIENHVFALENCDALEISKGGFSIATFNMEKDIARFAAAFRTLPAIRFADVPQLDDPVRVRTAKVDKKRFIYLLNRLPFAAVTEVKFDRKSSFTDLVTGKKISGSSMKIALAPYELKTFAMPEEVNISGGSTSLDKTALTDIQKKFQTIAAKYKSLQHKAGGPVKLYFNFAEKLCKNKKWARLYYAMQDEWVFLLDNLDNPTVMAFSSTDEHYIRRRKYPRKINAARIKTAVVMDGKLNDPVWQKTPEFTDFGDYFEFSGKLLSKPALQKTSVRILYDDRYLYFGIHCQKSDGSKVTVKKMPPDSALWLDDDSIELYLCSSGSEQGGHGHFAVNAAGSKCEMFNHDINWNPAWEAATSVAPDGKSYFMEIKIPFTVLGKNLNAENTWTFNIARNNNGNLASAIVAEQSVWWNCEALFAQINFQK